MSVLTYAIASDDDVDAASAQNGKKEHVRSDRMTGAADAADAQNIEKKRGVCSQRSENIAAQSCAYCPAGNSATACRIEPQRAKQPERLKQ